MSVSFSEAVTVTGTPQLALTIGTQTRQADYASGNGSSSLSFSYTVQPTDVDTDGVSIAANALTLNGGTIRDSDGNNAVLALGSHTIADASNHKVDGRISLWTFGRPQNGDTYGVNELVEVAVSWPFVVTASSPIGEYPRFSSTVPGGSGSALLTLTIGSAARQVQVPLTAGETVYGLNFVYEVQSADVDADGLSVAADALAVTGGTLQYSDGAAARLNLGTHAFANDGGHKIDGATDNSPMVGAVMPVSFPGRGGRLFGSYHTWRIGERIEVEVVFNEPVSVTGTPQLALTIGSMTRQADYLRCGGDAPLVGAFFAGGFCPQRVLVFGYVVQSSDVDADGISVANNALTLNGGSISDRGGNAATLTLPSNISGYEARFGTSDNSYHKVNGGGTDLAPVVVSSGVSLVGQGGSGLDSYYQFPIVSSPQSGDTFGVGEIIEASLLYNEPVTVTGTPQLALEVGTRTRQARYLRCAAYAGDPAGTCRLLTFGYAVQSSDSDTDGIRIEANALTLNGGTIRDRGGNNADLTITARGYPNRKVGGSFDRAPLPPPNKAPVAVGEFDDLDLDPGRNVVVSLTGKFRDPEGGALTYSAESLNPAVANAVVSNGRLWVDGRSPGLATVLVTATDSGGLPAQLAFRVQVGLVLTFAEASASAPEGGVARLKVELSRPSERTVSVGYVLESDNDPSTADADAEDHGGSDGTLALAAGETEAFIEVPILDDDDIEPAREFLRVRLLAPASETDWALGLATAAVVIQEGVCDRTPVVRDALRGLRECWSPSVRDLAGRGYLGLHRQGIGSLRGRDFLGMSGLRVLHLQGNGLSELPAGLFAGLVSLERLRLDSNQLSGLPDSLLEGLGRLSSMNLGGNRLSSLPAGLLAGAPSLSRLDLGGNRLSELPDGFFEGASNLSEADFSGNPGAPFTLMMELVRTDAEDFAPGPATVVARVGEGAPFALSSKLLAEGAELSTDMAVVAAGEVSGAPIQVSLSEGGAARLSLSGATEAPSELCGDVQDGQHPCFQGIRTEAGPGLVLFKRPPRVVRAVPEQGVESLGDVLSLDLSGFFSADGDDVLSYAAESSDPALASVRVSGEVLVVEPNGDGLEGLVTVRVMATDSDGLKVEHNFTVEVLPPSQRFGRGWRLGWLTGAPPNGELQ